MPATQASRFNLLLQKLFSLKERPAWNLLEDMFPILDLLSSKPEMYKLREENLFACSGRGLGGVGANGQVWCMNKVQGNLAVIDGLVLSSEGVGSEALVALTTVGLPADGAGGQNQAVGWDSRNASGGFVIKPAVSAANDQTGAPSFGGLRVQLSAGPIYVPVRIVLKSGWACVVAEDTSGANNNILVSFLGYERTVEPSELLGAP